MAFSLASVQAPAHGVSRAVNPLHFYPHCSFSAGGGGTPALRRTLLRAKHGRRPPSEVVACRLFSLFHVFFTILFSFFRFFTFPSHLRFCLRHAEVFAVFWIFLLAFRGLRHAVVLACFQRFWAVLCGRFQYNTICDILTKGNSVLACALS